MAPLEEAGCWASVSDDVKHARRPALFLDRDGVVVVERFYLARPEDVTLVPGAAETIAAFNEVKIAVVLVTNQSGVARGYFSWQDFEDTQSEVRRQLSAAAGANIDAVFACGYHEAGSGALGVGDHPWCKPNAGMLLAAADRLGLRLADSWIVGDRARDIAAGRAAGLAGGMQVMTGHADEAERRAALALAGPGFEVRYADGVADAMALLDLMRSPGAC